MASKVAEAKKKQGYRVYSKKCSNCKSFDYEDNKKRCRVGGFAVSNGASCKLHEYQENE